ncbi:MULTISPECIES: GspH/FimT family pseudopilin [Eikenella]|nr:MULTISPECIES: GspH/FimT family pseudopilin [Eikenella]VDG99276.1 Tfp pilus assembly protein FimT [Helicobacter pametensis]
MKTQQHIQGFTLIELMITLTLIGIMATLAMPSMSDFISNQRIAGHIDRVVTTFRFARTEAVRRNAPVLICGGIKLKSDAKPDNGCDKGGSSLLAFVDSNKDDDYQSSITNPNSDIDLRSVLIDQGNVNITYLDIGFNKLSTSNTKYRFIFLPNGSFGTGIKSGSSVPYTYASHYIRISASDGKRVRMALIAPSGRVVSCNTSMTPAVFDRIQAADYKNFCALS